MHPNCEVIVASPPGHVAPEAFFWLRPLAIREFVRPSDRKAPGHNPPVRHLAGSLRRSERRPRLNQLE